MTILQSLMQYFTERKRQREKNALEDLKARYHTFRIYLENNGHALELIVSIDGQLIRGEERHIRSSIEELLVVTGELVDGLNLLSADSHTGLYAIHGRMAADVTKMVECLADSPAGQTYCVHLDDLDPDAFPQAGAKAANLARLRNMALPVPNGFVCTTEACKRFLNVGKLAGSIRQLLHDVEHNDKDISLAAAEIREMILHAPLPEELNRAMEESYQRLTRTQNLAGGQTGPPAVSVRSSGVSEDGTDHSFAGQFTSLLNVIGCEALVAAYREVIASGFSARAISYRLNVGLSPVDFDLAVLCQVMVHPHCAGVMLTLDPSQPESGRMLISAVPGLGTMAVDGSAPVDLYHPKRTWQTGDAASSPKTTLTNSAGRVAMDKELAAQLMDGAQIANKTVREVATAGGGIRREEVPAEEASLPLLPAETLAELVLFGETIESLTGVPQDVEWAYCKDSGNTGKNGEVMILQARPLHLSASKGRRLRLPAVTAPLVSGTCASSGKTVGRVRRVHSAAELLHFGFARAGASQAGPSVLVLPQSIVEAARFVGNCVGVIIEVGNPTDHLSCIAREYGIPMLTGADSALSILQEAQWIMLDADQGVVVEAPESVQTAAAMAHRQRQQQEKQTPPDRTQHKPAEQNTISPQRQKLREMVVPLNLTDAYGPTFSLQECKSIHDIVRYTHEMAVLAMFNVGDLIMEEAGGLLRPLEIGVPFDFLVIDVGGGIRQDTSKSLRRRLAVHKPLGKDDILSIPLQAFCEGLLTPGLSWHSGPDLDALSDIFSRTLLDARTARPAGSYNYALAARDYLNLNARVEFHFAMLDAICGRDSHANYIRFRFKGGGAGFQRGRRRAIFLRHVLEKNAFYTTVADDLITASLVGASKEVVYERLIMLGRLMGFSRFLDGVMTDSSTPLKLAEAFLAGRYDSRNVLEAEDDS
ncbi:hypothetical protein FCL47_03365 [Desulfopila sp. IMCC35006]|uniref:PEP/pyruvate-binding domain-containing protein n=1 Tax=Desulfopila sp. IMCC35006 TaxID=2569542 RepID=UPI0010AD55F4|nr:PEP/pyruvate-binding domain-containing protein [Desulfopila sp. IMCC35006]TKB28535.1 hypothetical protein FCL47_03365 [Desulfopila sp. IMCC35006]